MLEPFLPLDIFLTLQTLGLIKDGAPLNRHYHRKAVDLLLADPQLLEILAHPHEILQPNNPYIWYAGGYYQVGEFIIARAYAINNYYLFEAGDAETYKASNFYGDFYAQFVRTIELPDFLAEVCDGEKFYDQITIREGDKGYYGQRDNSRGLLFDDACDLVDWLNSGGSGQKAREVGKDGTNAYEYTQVIFIIWGNS